MVPWVPENDLVGLVPGLRSSHLSLATINLRRQFWVRRMWAVTNGDKKAGAPLCYHCCNGAWQVSLWYDTIGLALGIRTKSTGISSQCPYQLCD